MPVGTPLLDPVVSSDYCCHKAITRRPKEGQMTRYARPSLVLALATLASLVVAGGRPYGP